MSGSRVVDATPDEIFELLVDPRRHVEFDGSGTVQHVHGDAQRLELGSKFGMSMKLGPIPYRISNKVVEFEENRRIAWAHFGKHRWRYELEPVEGGTRVVESFDYSTSPVPKGLELVGYPAKNGAAIDATLERLAGLFA